MSGEYVSREDVCLQLLKQESIDGQPRAIRRARRIVENCPAADVVERPRWISVKERMPEDGKNVLAYEGGGFYFLDWCCDGKWVVASESIAVVTHWMPLPEPPKEEAK